MSFREAATFRDEWLGHEIRGKREHEIALLLTGNQAVLMTESDWGYNMAKRGWDQNHFARCILVDPSEHAKTLNYVRLTDIEQGEKETAGKFLDRL